MNVSSWHGNFYSPSSFFSVTEKFHQIIENERVLGYIRTISVVALTIFLAPYSAVGIAFAASNLLVQIPSVFALDYFFNESDLNSGNVNSRYGRMVSTYDPFIIGVIGPVIEEVAFRGILQNVLLLGATYVLPTITYGVLGKSQITLAKIVAIAVTSISFGLVHAWNDHKFANQQALLASVTGVGLGVLASQYGFLAAVVAHITQNTVLIGAFDVAKLWQKQDSKENVVA